MADELKEPADLSGKNFPVVFRKLVSGSFLDEILPLVTGRREAYQDLFGISPADEYIQLALLLNKSIHPDEPREDTEEECLRLEYDQIHLEDQLTDLTGLADAGDPAAFLSQRDVMITLLTGTERIGSNGGSDGFIIDMFAQGDSHAVYSYIFGIESFQEMLSGSITSFFVAYIGIGAPHWDNYNKFMPFPLAPTEKERKRLRKIHTAFDQAARDRKRTGSIHEDPLCLFKRCRWLLEHFTGQPDEEFAAYLRDAPDYNVWLEELELIESRPITANYWLLHHFFLGNSEALKKTAERAMESHARMTRYLAQVVVSATDGLAGLDGETTRRLVEMSSRNADMKLFEPARAAAVGEWLGLNVAQSPSDEELETMERDPEALWRALEEYPRNVSGQDRILKALGKLDENLKVVIDEYFSERGLGARNNWPLDWQLEAEDFPFDERFSPAVAGAFISGLKFDSRNKNAYAGIGGTLARFDDDNVMNAYEKAIDVLAPDDERAERIFPNLVRSAHPRAPELLHKAAKRFLDIMEQGAKPGAGTDAERKWRGSKRGYSWGEKNFFHIPLAACLERGDEAAEVIARKLLEGPENFRELEMNLGRSMRVMGDRGITAHTSEIIELLNFVQGQHPLPGSHLEFETLMNFCEAAVALARLDRERAESMIPALFARETEVPAYDLDMKAFLLGAMFILRESDESELSRLHDWLERLLGNRDNHKRILGALRAAQIAGLSRSLEWVRRHLHSRANSLLDHHAAIKSLAFSVAESLGSEHVSEFGRNIP